jgi:hypothetical protein
MPCTATFLIPQGHCAGTAELESVTPSPLPSFVHLNMSCNVVVIQKGDVLTTFERAIAAFSRPMDPNYVEGDQQVRRVDVLLLQLQYLALHANLQQLQQTHEP